MKLSMSVSSVVIGATMVVGSAVAATPATTPVAAPTPATMAMVAGFVHGYAAREISTAPRGASTDTAAGQAVDLAVYPTANRESVFVAFRMADAAHIALVDIQNGQVKRFTDFAGKRAQRVAVPAPRTGDAQAQAGALLSPSPSFARKSSTAAAEHEWSGAQLQAARVLQSATVWTVSPQAIGHNNPRTGGEVLQARAVITSSIGQ
jgi:hypothetical protein